jgi:hypothetical protein
MKMLLLPPNLVPELSAARMVTLMPMGLLPLALALLVVVVMVLLMRVEAVVVMVLKRQQRQRERKAGLYLRSE